jgi:tryptophanyl-tRNA synthetase
MTEIAADIAPLALTGVRPTGDLTIANYLGAIQPIVDMQRTFEGDVTIFVADIHGLTDQEPRTVSQNVLSSARLLVAAGIDPQRSTVYLQSQIEDNTVWLAHMFDRHTTPAELSRVPTLKDKIRGDDTAETVSLSLFRYPVLMAADIAIQQATHVPVGEDQMPHIEFTRRIVRRFNHAYGSGGAVLVEPQDLARPPLRIAALQEKHGKMSKSEPTSALLLRDTPDQIARKIKKAQTAVPGEWPAILESHFTMAELLSQNEVQRTELARLKAAHLAGEVVMGDFKGVWTDIVNAFLGGMRERYAGFSESDTKVMLRAGGEQVRQRSGDTISRVKKALGFTVIL